MFWLSRIFNILIAFDQLYDELSDADKKEFMGTFVESIELYPERLENGKFLKHIHFRFPVLKKESECITNVYHIIMDINSDFRNKTNLNLLLHDDSL